MSAQGITLDRSGIFKARPFSWTVVTNENSQSVGINIGFLIDAQLEGEEWTSWKDFDAHIVYGTWYVIGREGAPNTAAIDQLAKSMGWNGNLTAIAGEPPDVVVQIAVKEDTYKEKTRFKASWMNPEDYVPTGIGASSDDVKSLQTRFGSLLRAAAASAVKPAGKPAAKPAVPSTTPAKPVPPATTKAREAKAPPPKKVEPETTEAEDLAAFPPEPVAVDKLGND